jgi:hypothetical protein
LKQSLGQKEKEEGLETGNEGRMKERERNEDEGEKTRVRIEGGKEEKKEN